MENQARKYTSPIIANVLAKRNMANYEKTKRNMLLAARIDDALKLIKPLIIKQKLAKTGDKIVIVSAIPFGKARESNLITVETL